MSSTQQQTGCTTIWLHEPSLFRTLKWYESADSWFAWSPFDRQQTECALQQITTIDAERRPVVDRWELNKAFDRMEAENVRQTREIEETRNKFVKKQSLLKKKYKKNMNTEYKTIEKELDELKNEISQLLGSGAGDTTNIDTRLLDMPQRIPSLEPKFFFGLTTGMSNNCFFVNDDKVAYRCAGVIVIYDTSSNSQKFVYLNDAQKTITTMAINVHRDLIAVGEEGKKPSVSIYNLTKCKYIQQLNIMTESKATSFVKIEFAYDNIHLAVLTGEPDFIMYLFNYKQSQVKSSVRVIHPPTVVGPVYDMAINPANVGLICFVGKGLFRNMGMGDSVWKQYGFHRANKFEFTTVCWLNEVRVLAGTLDGRLFLVESGELKAVYNVQTLWDFDPGTTIRNPLSVRPLSRKQDAAVEVRYCTPFKNGLMFVVNDYWIYYYKMKEDQKSFVRSAVFVVSEKPITTPKEEMAAAQLTGVSESYKGQRSNPINTLTVNPKTTKILCATQTRLYVNSISGLFGTADVVIKPLGEQLHVGGVAGMSISDRKPTFMTCGRHDRTVKLWDYKRRVLLLSERYPDDDVLDVSLHPSGLYAVLAFRGRALFVTIHGPAKGLRPRAELVGHNDDDGGGGGGGLVRFSASGHMFAVVDGPHVRIYCSVTFQKRFAIAGHEAEITDLVWAANDWQLYTCDADGRVCQFDLYHGKYTNNLVFPDQAIYGLAVSDDLARIYTATREGRLQNIFHWTVTRNQNLQRGALNAILLSGSNSILFVTSQNGGVLSLSLPIESSEIEFKEFNVHNQTISKMKMTADDGTLITCSMDGSICIWDVKNVDREESVTFPNDIIVSRRDFKRKMDMAAILNSRLDLLTKQSLIDMAELENFYNKRLQALDEQHSSMVDLEAYHSQKANALHEACITSLINRINATKEKHELDMKMAKEDYEKKLIYEDNKYETFEKDTRDMDKEMEKKIEKMIKAHNAQMKTLSDEFNMAIKEKEDMFEKFKEQFDEEKKLISHEIDEFDDQCDRDVLKLKISFRPKIKKYLDQHKKIQREIDIHKTKIELAQKTEKDLLCLTEKYREDIVRMRSLERTLDAAIADKNNEIQECGEALRNKDSWLRSERLVIEETETEILATQREKEKMKGIVNPLKKTLGAINKTIENVLKMHLIDLDRRILSIESECNFLKQRRKVIRLEIKKLDKSIRENNASLKKTRIDLHFEYVKADHNVALLHEYLIWLNHRYESKIGDGNTDLFKQRQFLEKCIAHLEARKMVSTRRKPSYLKKTEEQSVLIAMINKLKKETAHNRNKCEELSNMIAQQQLDQSTEPGESSINILSADH